MEKLTLTERWILSNQYRILSHLDPGSSQHYNDAVEVIERGYELEYGNFTQQIAKDQEVMTEDRCRFLFDVLETFDRLEWTYQTLDDKTGVDPQRMKFLGFDGNTEGDYMAYADYILRSGRFTTLQRPHGLNSHAPTLNRYRRIVAAWKESEDRNELTKEDLIRIGDAGRSSV